MWGLGFWFGAYDLARLFAEQPRRVCLQSSPKHPAFSPFLENNPQLLLRIRSSLKAGSTLTSHLYRATCPTDFLPRTLTLSHFETKREREGDREIEKERERERERERRDHPKHKP